MEQNGKCCNQSKLIMLTLALMSTLFLSGIYMKVSIILDLYTNVAKYSLNSPMDGQGCPYMGNKKWYGKKGMKGSMSEMQGPVQEMEAPAPESAPMPAEEPTAQ